MPTTNTAPKNTAPTSAPPGILANTSGITTKRSRGPLSICRPSASTAGTMIMPASSAAPTSAVAVPTAMPGIESSSRR